MSDHQHDSHDDHGVGHIVSPKILFATAAALVVLTIITVVGSRFDFAEYDLPEVNIWLALIIATTKATLVSLFFMHLWWDRVFNSIILVASVGFVGIMMMFAIIDTREYRSDIVAGDAVGVKSALVELAATDAELEASGEFDHGHDDETDAGHGDAEDDHDHDGDGASDH